MKFGCSAGYWAHCMKQRGIDCLAFDRHPPVGLDGQPRTLWSEVIIGGAEQLMEAKNAGVRGLVCGLDNQSRSWVFSTQM
jgi:hypothetical protein